MTFFPNWILRLLSTNNPVNGKMAIITNLHREYSRLSAMFVHIERLAYVWNAIFGE